MADRRLAWALVAVIVRYLTTIQPQAHRELARWRQRAHAIPDPTVRAHVLHPFEADDSAAGAALFAVLAPLRMQRRLVRLLVAYVLLWSYVDVRTERDSDTDPRLYDALVDGLRPDTEPTALLDDDAGYLATLLHECRRGCASLPSWDSVQPAALRLAHDGRAVQAINHGRPASAEGRLRTWASRLPERPWWEQCAAASSPLAIHALMAAASHSDTAPAGAQSTAAAYRPVSALAVLCDHLIDRPEDHQVANHSYLRYVSASSSHAGPMINLAARAVRQVQALPVGERHAVILAAMTAMFLAQPHGSGAADEATALAILTAVGTPAAQLRAVLRAWSQLKSLAIRGVRLTS